jgi:hypothetical protein
MTEYGPGDTVPYDVLVLLAREVGMADPEIMAAIAMAESGGRTDARHVNSNGSVDRGLWQINGPAEETPARKGLYTPGKNAMVAASILQRQGKGAWVAYTNGSYKKFLKSESWIDKHTTSPDEIIDATKSGASSVLDGVLGPVTTFLKEGAVTVGVFVLALVFIIVGLVMLANRTKAGKAAIGAGMLAVPGLGEVKGAKIAQGALAAKTVATPTEIPKPKPSGHTVGVLDKANGPANPNHPLHLMYLRGQGRAAGTSL